MIILGTPVAVKVDLGGTDTVAYNHVVLSPMTLDPVSRIVTASARCTSSTAPEMEAINGALTLELGPGKMTFLIEAFGIYVKRALSPGEITSIQNIINTTQNSLENGCIAVGIIDGTQSTGV